MPVPLRPAWLALAEHARSIKHRHLRDLFAAVPESSLVHEIENPKTLVVIDSLECLPLV
jgi:hypothetical protein